MTDQKPFAIETALKEYQSNRLIDSLFQDEFETKAGKVYFGEATADWSDTATAILRIHDLHLRATGQKPCLALNTTISVKEAQALYRNSISCYIATICLLNDAGNLKVLKTLLSLIQKLNSTGGLEPVFLTSLFACTEKSDNENLRELIAKFKEIGLAENPASGHGYIVFYDKPQSILHSIDPEQLRELIQTREIERPANLMAMFRARESRFAMSDGVCRGIYRTIGGVAGSYVGAAAGGMIGGALGGPFGAQVGAEIGFYVGRSSGAEIMANMNCNRDDNDRSRHGNRDDSNRGTPEPDPKEVKTEENGCVANPSHGDYDMKNPYTSLIRSQELVAVPFGKGLDAFVVKNSLGKTALHSLPKFELMGRELSIQRMGFFTSASRFNSEIIRIQSTRFENNRPGRIDRVENNTSITTNSNVRPGGTGGLKPGVMGGLKPGVIGGLIPGIGNGSFNKSDPFEPKPRITRVEREIDPNITRINHEGYTVQTNTSYYVQTNESGDPVADQIIKSEETTILVSNPYLAMVLGSDIITGSQAEILANNPKLITLLLKGEGWTTVGANGTS